MDTLQKENKFRTDLYHPILSLGLKSLRKKLQVSKINVFYFEEILVPGVTHSVIQYVKHNKVMTGHHVLFPLFYFPLVVVRKLNSSNKM